MSKAATSNDAGRAELGPLKAQNLGGVAQGREFVALIAACMAIVALSIDAILPAFGEIRSYFGLGSDSTQVAWIITAYFLGLASGQLFYGPLSDRFGRKPLLYCGLLILAVGAAGAALAPSLALVIVFRFLWGIGSAGPRSLALAIVRDTFEGEEMARTMSLVMAIFIVVPVFAPTVGALLLHVAAWQAVFWLSVVAAGAVALWARRLPETLPPERRRADGPAALVAAGRIVLRTRPTVAYGLATAFLFSSMSAYLSSSEIIVDEVFRRKSQFPLIFGGIAIFMGIATFLNAKLVQRLGLPRLLRRLTISLVLAAVTFFTIVLSTGGKPPLLLFCAGLAVLLPVHTMLLPSCNTAAMGPVGQVAGTAAAIIGTASTAIGALLGSIVVGFFDGSVKPLAIGMLLFDCLAAVCVFVGSTSRSTNRSTIGSMPGSLTGSPIGSLTASPPASVPPQAGRR